MTLLFTTIGSAADYGSFGRWFLLVITCICWATQYATISLTSAYSLLLPTILHLTSLPPHVLLGPSRWPLGMVLYMIGYITYGATLVFYAAVFPRLARNTPHSRSLKAKLENEEIQKEEYVFEESMEKNRISNISTVSVLESFGCG